MLSSLKITHRPKGCVILRVHQVYGYIVGDDARGMNPCRLLLALHGPGELGNVNSLPARGGREGSLRRPLFRACASSRFCLTGKGARRSLLLLEPMHWTVFWARGTCSRVACITFGSTIVYLSGGAGSSAKKLTAQYHVSFFFYPLRPAVPFW